MSHVTIIAVEIKDLDCLRQAADELGMEFIEGQKTFKAYTPKNDCDHALKVKGQPDAYEVGLRRKGEETDGYNLAWDSWCGGCGLVAVVGDNCHKLVQKYAEKVVMKGLNPMRARGWNVLQGKNAQGEIVLRCVKG